MPRPRPRDAAPPTPTLAERLAADAATLPGPSEDALEKLRKRAVELFDADRRVVAAEAELEAAKDERTRLAQRELPAIFDAAGVDRIGLPEQGADMLVQPYYHASLSAERMEPAALEAAFDHLEALGGGDLIRTSVIVPFPREGIESARRLLVSLRAAHPDVRLDRSVPWASLTAFIREIYEADGASAGNRPPVDLEALGATVARVCKIKLRKAKKR